MVHHGLVYVYGPLPCIILNLFQCHKNLHSLFVYIRMHHVTLLMWCSLPWVTHAQPCQPQSLCVSLLSWNQRILLLGGYTDVFFWLNFLESQHLATCRTDPAAELESSPPEQGPASPAPQSAQSVAGHTAHPDCSFSSGCWSATTAAAVAAAGAAICELCAVAA